MLCIILLSFLLPLSVILVPKIMKAIIRQNKGKTNQDFFGWHYLVLVMCICNHVDILRSAIAILIKQTHKPDKLGIQIVFNFS